MKTLILSGSPHTNGDTAALLDALCETLTGEVKRLDAYRAEIHPCIDCRRCKDGPCTFRDLDDLYRDMASYDNIVLASPLYFNEMTGMLLNVVSRFEYFYLSGWKREDAKKRTAPRRGAVILVGGGSTKDCSHALATAHTVLRELGAQPEADVCYVGTDDVPAARCETALEQARALGRALSR